MQLSDEELMVMFAAGAIDAFTMLYERYRHRIYRFALSCLGVKADAEDVVQDVFVRVAGAADRYQPTARFRSWLFQISANRIRDIGRQQMKWRTPDRIPEAAHNGCDQRSLEKRLEASDTLKRLMEMLTPEERMLILLKELEGMDSAAVARIMGLSPEAVRVRLHRIRTALKSRLDDSGVEKRHLEEERS